MAEIAAKTMNGYFIKERKLVCHVLSEQHPDPFTYKHGSKKLHFINWAVKFREESNKVWVIDSCRKNLTGRLPRKCSSYWRGKRRGVAS